MSFILGVDGGNTKTIALVAREDGTILGFARGGCGDIYGGPPVQDVLYEAVRIVMEAAHQAGINSQQLSSGAFSMAGADWPEDFTLLQETFEQHGLGRKVTVVNDAIGGLWAGSPDGTGVAVICGTGTATGARAADGRVWHTSFWQEPHGSRQLAEKTLVAVNRAALGVDPPTVLTERTLALLGMPTVEALLHQRTGRDLERPARIQRLARILFDTASDGDPTARQIVINHGRALGDYALIAARQVGIADTPFTLVLGGGVLRHPSTLLSEALIERVREFSPGIRPTRSQFEPALGALLIGFDQAGIPANTAVLERLSATLPPAELYSTEG